MLLASIRSFLKTVLRHEFLILDTHNTDTVCFREQTCEDPSLFFETKKDPQAKSLGKTELVNNEFVGCERKLSWPTMMYYTSTCLEKVRKNMRHVNTSIGSLSAKI
jgi:hypothetical protein